MIWSARPRESVEAAAARGSGVPGRRDRGPAGRGSRGAVAAVAVGALAIGSVGFAFGSGRAAPDAGRDGAAPAITLGQPRAASAAAGRPGVLDAHTTEQAAGPAGDVAAAVATVPADAGGTVFTAVGLPSTGGSAQAWAFDPARAFTAQTATRLAAALGLAGEAVLSDGAWVVGPVDGTGPSLRLSPDATSTVTFTDPTRDPSACQASGGPDQAPVAGPSVDEPVCLPPELFGAVPDRDAAMARVRDLLAALGLDPAAFGYGAYGLTVEGVPHVSTTVVSADLLVDGRRTGVTWQVGFTGDGVQSLHGALAEVVPLGPYDVVSPEEAVARLADLRFGPAPGGLAHDLAGLVGPVDVEGGAGPGADGPNPNPTIPSTVRPGDAIGWPVTEVRVVSARPGLTLHAQPDGAMVLLPAYELTAESGQGWTVLALAEHHLDLTPVADGDA